jgi:hypothetical protein
MKRLLLFLTYLWISLSGFSQFDPGQYFANSRYDYYTGEKTGQVLVYVPESKTGMNVTVDLVLDFNFLNRNAVVFPGHAMPVSFGMENFKQGNNEVTVSFYEDGKWVDSRKVNVLVRPGKPNEVRCDLLTGTLVADGLPFFPVGFYCQWPVFPTLPEEEVVKGFNMMSPYWKIDNKQRKERLRFMDRCAQLGMKVNYNICNVAAGGVHTEALSKDEKLALLKKEVEALRDHPALLSWYLYDEPEGQGVPADSLKAAYDLIKTLDPYHPVTIVFMAPHMANQYAHVMDIAMTDPYPVPNGPIAQVEEYVEILNGYFRYQKPVWVVPQAFGGNEWWTREPDPREVRAMTYLGLIHNASGVKYFIRKGLNGSPKSQAMWGECGEIAQEVMELLPSLAYGQPAPPAWASVKEIQARAINHNGLITILVVNTQNKPMEFDIRLKDLDLVMDVEVVGEGRKVQMKAGLISDIIDAYGTRLYRVENRIKPDWQKDISKGNLTRDPGFEDISSPGIPAACYVQPGSDRGATFFLDGRVHKQGDHSIRLVTPVEGGGAKLQFFGLELDPDKSYTCSVWAKAAPGIPESKPKPIMFNLSLGVDHHTSFELTDDWSEYSLGTAGKPVKASLHRWSMPALELESAGTAWFDLLQVVPDMEMMHRAKGIGQSGSGEVGRQSGLELELKSARPDARITYTLDGSAPTSVSTEYTGPFLLTQSATVIAAAFRNEQLAGTIQKYFLVHRGIGANVKYDILYEKYDAGGRNGLVDGILATDNYKDGRWQGFHGIDGGILLDLGSAQPVSKVSLRFLQDRSVWIFLPTEVEIMLSQDGITYQAIATTTHDIPLDRHSAFIHEFSAEFTGLTARYVRVEAKSIGTCPAWHSGAGQPGWIFTDEIVVN